jgi:hypothetical protein
MTYTARKSQRRCRRRPEPPLVRGSRLVRCREEGDPGAFLPPAFHPVLPPSFPLCLSPLSSSPRPQNYNANGNNANFPQAPIIPLTSVPGDCSNFERFPQTSIEAMPGVLRALSKRKYGFSPETGEDPCASLHFSPSFVDCSPARRKEELFSLAFGKAGSDVGDLALTALPPSRRRLPLPVLLSLSSLPSFFPPLPSCVYSPPSPSRFPSSPSPFRYPRSSIPISLLCFRHFFCFVSRSFVTHDISHPPRTPSHDPSLSLEYRLSNLVPFVLLSEFERRD